MIGDAEEGPERIDSAERIHNTLVKKVPPQSDDDGAGQQDARHPTSAAKGLPEAAAEILNHKASNTRSRIEHGKNEERFEHDRKVIPDAEEALAADSTRKDLRHAYGK